MQGHSLHRAMQRHANGALADPKAFPDDPRRLALKADRANDAG
jgi:hypothetical protein